MVYTYRVHGTIVESNERLDDGVPEACVDFMERKKNRHFESLTLKFDGDEVDVHFVERPEPFERIRRITGYLVGDMSQWNDSKKAEERDRVSHLVKNEMEKL